MKKQKAITLVSVVITIIILIILAGISINAMLGENGIIAVAKQAKENMQLAQEKEQTELNELCKQMGEEIGTSDGITYDAIAKLAEFKRVIADAITNKGIQTSQTDTAEAMAKNIGKLEINTLRGIRTDSYIFNKKEATTTYSTIDSMTGLTRLTDKENNISEYLSYSNLDGYTVLKSGWYFIVLNTTLNSQSDTDLTIRFLINGVNINNMSVSFSSNNISDYNSNSFPIYLSKGDKINFQAISLSGTGQQESCYVSVAEARCFPMF